MDAPTTTSAGKGASGGNNADGGGWFAPRTPENPQPGNSEPAASGPPPASGAAASEPSGEPRRASRIRPVGRPTEDGADGPAAQERSGAAPSNGRPETVPEQWSAFGPRPGTPASGHPDQSAPTGAAPTPAPGTTGGQPAAPAAEGPGDRSAAPASASPEKPAAKPAASPDAVLIQRTMAEVGPVAGKVTSYFYALLFVRHPDLRPLFPAAMDTQRDRLLKALLTAAEHIDNEAVLGEYLRNLGRGHRKYGTQPEHYPAVGECLIGALSQYAPAVWNAETEAAWVRAYTRISQIMIDAASADELRAPAWWFGEVVSHELRTPDIAVVTVRPDQPYPFLAGQYASLETPWWPRVWRHYSFASAPRSDGLLTFHVKAVPAGWVSNALVHRARPGDVVRLGPPAGSMTVDHATGSGLLCLGGGTGIAPIKALVEDVAEHGKRRRMDVFYGARTDHDLYDIDTMMRLQQTHPWLSVRPVVDQQAAKLPDAVRAYGPWNEYDAYLSGPPGMIRSGVHALRDVGIPTSRIRHDSVEELVAAGD